MNTVTQEEINNLLDNAKVEEFIVFDKCFVVCYKLPNGFILTESSACVDPKNFNVEVGRKICRERIENRLWELEGYSLQKRLCRPKKTTEQISKDIENLSPMAKKIYEAVIGSIDVEGLS